MLLKKGMHFYLVIGLFAVYLINGLIAIPRNSVTYDEMDHWSYGKRILKLQPQLVYPYDDAGSSPFYGVNALPRAVEQLINPDLLKTDGGFSDIMNGRYVTLIICMLIGVFIYFLSKEMFGETAGLFSLFLFVFCPNMNAYSMIFTSDAYTALCCLSAFYFFWKFVKYPVYKYFIFFSISLGISLIMKYSLIHLLPIFAVLSIIVLLKRKTLFSNWKKNLLRLVVSGSIILIIMNAAYFFYGTGQSLSGYHFRSSFFQSLQTSFLGDLPLPLPVPYVEGFDITYHMMELGAGNPLVSAKNYLLGELSTDGFWYFYIVVFFFKTSIPYLAIILLLAFMYIKQRKFDLLSAEFMIGFGLLYYLIVFSSLVSVQAGIRHILFIYPLLYILAGRVVNVPWKPKMKKMAVVILVAWLVAGFYFYFPNLLSYTNEFILNKRDAYKIMAESNLDFGQCDFAIKKYLKQHTDVKLADSIPRPGKFVVGVNYYLNIYGDNRLEWLKNFKPVCHIDHCYLLIEVKEEDLKRIQ